MTIDGGLVIGGGTEVVGVGGGLGAITVAIASGRAGHGGSASESSPLTP